MIEIIKDIFSINELLKDKYPFAVFRAPRENKIHVIVQNDNNLYTTDNIDRKSVV